MVSQHFSQFSSGHWLTLLFFFLPPSSLDPAQNLAEQGNGNARIRKQELGLALPVHPPPCHFLFEVWPSDQPGRSQISRVLHVHSYICCCEMFHLHLLHSRQRFWPQNFFFFTSQQQAFVCFFCRCPLCSSYKLEHNSSVHQKSDMVLLCCEHFDVNRCGLMHTLHVVFSGVSWHPIKTRIQTSICEKRLLAQNCCFHEVREEPQPHYLCLCRKYLHII